MLVLHCLVKWDSITTEGAHGSLTVLSMRPRRGDGAAGIASGYCSGIGNHVVEQVRPQDQGVAARRDAGLDRQVQGAGGADGQADPGGQVPDLGYQ